MPVRLDASAPDFAAAFGRFLATGREEAVEVDAVVAKILAEVAADGDTALVRYTKQFDGIDFDAASLRVTPGEIDAAAAACAPDLIAAIDKAATRIEAFHRRQLPEGYSYEDGEGNRLGLRWTPVAAAGLYVPGGRAAYPSSVLMNAIPAKVAGVPRLVMVVPTPGGVIVPAVLAAARRAGVDEIYRVGGAQAVAALAYGTETIVRVDVIVGPGNAYVAAAKRMVFGRVGIDSIAGPSEILVVADKDNDPSWVAIDLLSQAEHDPSARSILVTDDAAFATAVSDAVDTELAALPRAEIAGASWRDHGAIILVPGLEAAPAIVDQIAPEHLELAVADPAALAAKVRNAGAIFLGRHAPEAIGDYVAGPNHVLPTSGAARYASGLGVVDFMKRTTLIECGPGGISAIGPAAITLARAEGLEAHARSVAVRLEGRRN
ncbi:MAG TPA: histidinol dehydrogenase [Alphaproteobacteria bacterium]|nr:histidinol dehydrogenase [Alphaproteobacteria bacterium]